MKFEVKINDEKLNVEIVNVDEARYDRDLGFGKIYRIKVDVIVNSEELSLYYDYYFNSRKENKGEHDYHNWKNIWSFDYLSPKLSNSIKKFEYNLQRIVWEYALSK